MADSEIDEAIKTQIVMTAEGLTSTIIPLSDEEIKAYLDSGDEFTEGAMEAWNDAKAEVGEFVEAGSAEVEFSNRQYTATVPVDFEKLDAEFVYVFEDVDGVVISLFKFIPGSQGTKKEKKETAPAPIPVPAVPVPETVQDADEELVAVIAAAIAAAEGTTTDGFVVRSIRKIKRPRR